jgi:hypothetical protein
MKPGLKARSDSGFRGGRVSRVKKPLTRKERRKQERNARKQRAATFHSKNKTRVDYSTTNRQNLNARKIKKKLQKSGAVDWSISRTRTQTAKTPEGKASTSNKVRGTASQLLAMRREEKEIARLEKLLRMKKRKKLPATFKDEGLDCILF